MNEYLELLKAKLTNILGEDYDISYKSIFKNNGVKLHGIYINNKASNITPVIYVDDYYGNGLSIEESAERVIELYNNSKRDSIETKWFFCFENVKNSVIPKLINEAKNQELLKDIPYIKWEDLAIIFQVYLDAEFDGSATITITNEHMKLWNVTAGELYSLAKSNVNRIKPYKIKSLMEVIGNMTNCLDISDDLYIPMYVLSSEDNLNGSYYMTCNYILKEFAEEIGTNVIILPSSTHEVILLPNEGYTLKELQFMVKEINQTEIKPDDFLSDNVYYYDRETNSITRTEHVL